MKTWKKFYNITLVLSVIVIMCISIMPICFGICDGVVFADETAETISLEEECEQLTASESFEVDKETHYIDEYQSYVWKTFDIGNSYNLNKSTDEWIFHIVPKRLFEQKTEDFLYIGDKYGFYFNYEEPYCLVYLIKHEITVDKTDGKIVRKITPLYYEKYWYNEETGKASLRYIYDPNDEYNSRYYLPCSYDERLFLKNVSFDGVLYNYNTYNLY